MASETLSWVYRLIDGVTGPARTMKNSLDSLGDALGKSEKSMLKAEVAGVGLSKVIDLVGAAARGAAGAGLDFGKFALDALSFKESTLASFEIMLGTKKEAEDMFNMAAGFGRLTPFETEDVVNSFKSLLAAGFSKQEVPIVFQAVGDVAALNGMDKNIMGQLSTAFSQIKGAGKLMGQDLMQVVNAASGAGVGRGAIFESIAKMLKVRPADVSDLMSEGKIASDVAIKAIMNTIRERVSRGDVGAAMLRQSTTLAGLFSTLKSAPMDAFLAMNLDNLPGFTAFKRFIGDFVAMLDPTSLTGGRLRTFFEDIVNRVGTAFGQLTPDVLISGMEKLLSIGEEVFRGFEAFGSGLMKVVGPTLDFFTSVEQGQSQTSSLVNTMDALGRAVGVVAVGLATIATLITKVVDGFKAFGDIDYDYGFGLIESGKNAAKGFGQGILSAISVPMSAAERMALSSSEAANSALEVHSPSRVFARIGGFVAQGFAGGIDDGTGEADAAIGRLVDARQGSAKAPQAARAPAQVTLNIEVNGSGAPEEVARRLTDLLPSALTSLFDQMAIEEGA